MKKPRKPLTERQARLLKYATERKNWHPPTWEEMRDHMGMKGNESIRSMLSLIRKKGYPLPKWK